ncbi:hypothetical protein DL93DRAFT_2234428 [Clavulina sp. PMI_390]|nr:hypothetical protein DL93DRAFT_2234428 [Clavulina sp. PMI_390]
MDASYFLRCLSLPLSHPESIHPCLLNACYLGACVISKGGLSSLEAYFVRRTRHFLEQSLMYADRIPHFLWASVILGSHLLRLRRLEEAFAVISGAARMSSACGLVHEHNAGLADGDRLLPPPRNEQEADDRLKLARSVYIIDQSLAAVSGYPMTFPGDDSWGPSTNVLQLWGQQREEKKSGGGEVLELWQSERFKVSILKLIEQVNRFAFAVHGRSGSRASEEGYAALGYLISSYVGIIPALVDVGRPGPPKPLTELEITVLSAHITLDGGGLLLHSLRAGEDPEARRQMFGYLRALVGALKWIKWYRPLYKIQAGLVPMILVMNATKIVANELGRFQVMAEVGQSIDYCQVLEVLLHYLEDSSLVYPRWANTHIALKDPLTKAVNSFSV